MILIGADFVPTVSNYELFYDGNSRELFSEELEAILTKADFRIFNLETPLCDELHPINKCGKNFASPTACVKGYSCIHTDLLTLANNHIMDQGAYGLDITRRVLKENHIAYVGAGDDVQKAAAPFLFQYGGKMIGVYACAEHEFSIATANASGANPFDPLETPDHIAQMKKQCDYVIVLYHGGKEYYPYPSPMLQKTCRKLVDKGADLVICQHSHCIGCEEKYHGGTIVYGQGNFLFDNTDHEMWQTSLLVCIDNEMQISYIPLVKEGNGVRLANGERADTIMESFNRRSEEILREGFVEEQFAKFADSLADYYLTSSHGKQSFVFKALNKLSGNRMRRLVLKHYGKSEQTELLNYIRCEAIREVFIQGLRNRIEGK